MGVKFSGFGRIVLLVVLALFLSWRTAVAQSGPTIEIDGDDTLTASSVSYTHIRAHET